MRKIAFLICVLNLFLQPALHADAVLERILAVVNDEVITERDLQMIMAPVVAQQRTSLTGAELEERLKQIREDYLQKTIEEKLVLSEAKRLQVIVKDEEVDDMIEDVKKKFPTREVFLKAIEDQGLTERKLWERFRDQLMSQKLVGYEVKSRVSVSPGEISEYYKAHTDEFQQGDSVRLQQILIRTTARSEDDAKSFADQVVKELQGGRSFEELAKAYSEGAEAKEGGEMGWVEHGQFVGEIDSQIFALQPGQVTAPIKSALGFHIFKVVERKQFSVKPLSEVRDMIHEQLLRQKNKEKLDSWIEQLKKNAYISIR